jgi:hypothetical protein
LSICFLIVFGPRQPVAVVQAGTNVVIGFFRETPSHFHHPLQGIRSKVGVSIRRRDLTLPKKNTATLCILIDFHLHAIFTTAPSGCQTLQHPEPEFCDSNIDGNYSLPLQPLDGNALFS